MERHIRLRGLLAVCALALTPHISSAQSLHATRASASDLEVTGLSPSPGYLTRAELLALPQASAIIANDPDFPGLTLHVTGVPLAALASALHAQRTDSLIDALCTDRYRSHYPAEYIARHNPILVLQVEGKTPAEWSASTHNEDPGPYFVAHANYKPAFKVLAHEDQRQVPTNVVRLNFTTGEATYTPITPPGPATKQVEEGFTIAKQNCLRCHSQGSVGGTKSPFTWAMLVAIARADPTTFSRYILNPKDILPQAAMPANPTYDQATRAALTAYFTALDPKQEAAR